MSVKERLWRLESDVEDIKARLRGGWMRFAGRMIVWILTMLGVLELYFLFRGHLPALGS